ncbi:MAG: hypothetical protein WCG91_01375 [Candidatus Shapirobacteria bacterium]
MHFTCRPFIGKPSANNWSQYWENEPDDPILIHQRGHLFGLINLGIESREEDLNIIGHDIIYELNQNYFSCDNQENIQECLKNALISVINNPLYQTNKLEILIAVVLKNNLYLVSSGLGKVILCRDNKISSILKNDNQEIKTLSGPINPEDKIFLSTNSFFEQFTWEKIKMVLSNQKMENIEEDFLSTLYSLDNQDGLASVLIQTHNEEDQTPTLETEAAPNESLDDSIADFNQFSQTQQIQTPNPPKKSIFSFFKRGNKDSVYISHHDIGALSKRKKINLVIAIVLILALITSFYFGYQKNQSIQNEKKYQSLKSELDKKFTDIIAVKSLNLNSAQQLARDSESIIKKMTDLKLHSDEIITYQTQVQQILSQTGATDHFSPALFYDMSISFKSSQYSKLLLKGDSLYLLDSANGRLDSLNIPKKSSKSVMVNDQIKNLNFLAENSGELYLANKTNIFLVKNTSLESKVDLSTSTIDLTDIKFWNGAIYVLDQKNLNIWKLNSNSTAFGAPQLWLKNDAKLDANPLSLAINGNISVLHKNGQISSYSSGVKQDFKLVQQGESSQTSNLNITLNSGIFVFVDNQNIIYVYKKTGELQSKYNFDKLKIADIAVDEKTASIFVLATDQKIYQIKL